MSVQPPRDRPPQGTDGLERLGAYLLLEEQASGELCSVHLAQAQQDDGSESPTVIIKRLHRRHILDPEKRFALQREAELGARIRSPHIVRALLAEDAQQPYVVMEQLHGANLSVLLSRASQPLDLEGTRHVIPLLVEALQGLSDLHGSHPDQGAHFVHQAPCARHIMACSDGHARIIDLTLTMDTTLPRSRLCDERLRPAEMAPEQALAPSHLDPRCDVFIVGVALWEALTGRRLFAADTPQQTLDRMLRSAMVAPSQAGAASGRTFDRVCMRALARPRRERYGSAAEFAGELREEAIRAGLYADAAEVSAWVSNTLDAAPQARGRGHTRPGHGTIQGLGELNFGLAEITQGVRDSQLDEPTTRVSRPAARGGRDQRSSGAAPAPFAPCAPSVPPAERDREFALFASNRGSSQIARKSSAGLALPRQQTAFAMFCLVAAVSLALMALFSRDLLRIVPPALSGVLEAVSAAVGAPPSSDALREVAAANSSVPAARDRTLDTAPHEAQPQPAALSAPVAAVPEARAPAAAPSLRTLSGAREPSAPSSRASADRGPSSPGPTHVQAAPPPSNSTPLAAAPPPSAKVAPAATSPAAKFVAKPQPKASAKPHPKMVRRPAQTSAQPPAKRDIAQPPGRSPAPSEVPLPLLESGSGLRATQFGRAAANQPSVPPAPAEPATAQSTQANEELPINPY